jgi:cyclin H
MTYHPKSIMLCCLFLACKADHFYLSLRRFIDSVDPDGGVTEDDVKAPEFLLLQGLRFTLEVRHPMRGLQGGVADMMRLVKEGKLGEKVDERRVGKAADKVKGLLKREAQMTDVYFLFTPSQIWLGAWWAVDQGVAEGYLRVKVGELGEKAEGELGEKVIETVKRCAEVLMG